MSAATDNADATATAANKTWILKENGSCEPETLKKNYMLNGRGK